MKQILSNISFILLIHAIVMGTNIGAETRIFAEKLEASEEYQIGVMVKGIQHALKNPKEKGSLETIIKYGLDSRYYMMIRGWVMLELSGIKSQYEATEGESGQQKHKIRINFLEKAIRAIDLE